MAGWDDVVGDEADELHEAREQAAKVYAIDYVADRFRFHIARCKTPDEMRRFMREMERVAEQIERDRE